MQKVGRALQEKPPASRAAALLAHPIRVLALTILVDRVASPAQIAEEIGETVQLVNNHIKVLRDGDAVELMKTVKRGGANEHYYRATRRPELTHDEWLELSDAHKVELLLVGIRNFFAESLASVEAGKMVKDPHIYWWWKAVLLDQEGQEEKKQEQDRHVARLLEIEARANARVVESEGKAQAAPAVLGVMGFNRARSNAVNEFMT
ncbi:MAG: hypothetical protein ACTHK3_10765 [Solirubrobacterales bacterium]